MDKEALKINWRTKNTAEHLLNPLYRQLEESKLRHVYEGMEIKLMEAKIKKPDADYSDTEFKIESLVEIAEYQRFLFELAYQSNLAAYRAEQRSLEYISRITELKLDIKSLQQQLEFTSS